jgi:hypothetical protein
LALIGLVAFFEGFCKNHTAAILNICPQLACELSKNGRDIKLSPSDIVNHAENLSTQFGSLVVEKIDFGTAKAINSLYMDLLRVTPLSKREADRFHALLDDRNVIVHHGNIFTPKYPTERFVKREIGSSRTFLDSLVVSRNDVRQAAQFLHQLSIKMRRITETALLKYVTVKRVQKQIVMQLPICTSNNRAKVKYQLQFYRGKRNFLARNSFYGFNLRR